MKIKDHVYEEQLEMDLDELFDEEERVEMTTPASRIEDLVKEAIKKEVAARKTMPDKGVVERVPVESVEAIEEIVTSTSTALKENQKLFSVVISNAVKDDFGVTVFDTYDWSDKIAGFIPKVNSDYVIDPDLARSILQAWELGEKVLCYGPTGAGKSSLIEQLCARTHRPFVRVNCTGDMDSSMIFGQLTAKDGSTIWVDGAVTEAVRYGAVFAWDEWDVTPPEISMGLQWLLEDEGKLFLKEMPGSTSDKQIVPHENFRIVAIGNTQGQGDETGAHAGTNVQNSATLDRFGTAVYIDYMDPTTETVMLLNKFDSSKKKLKEVAANLVKVANLIRQGYQQNQLSLTMSPRALFSIMRKVEFGNDVKQAFNLVYANKLSDTQKKVSLELYNKVFGMKS